MALAPLAYNLRVAFSEKNLSADEEIVLDLNPHWWYLAPSVAALVVLVIVGIINLVVDTPSFIKLLSGVLVLVALGYFAIQFAQWSSTNFVVTNERVISRSGVVSKTGIEIPLDRINTVFFNQSLFERLLGAGDLGIESAGEGGRQTFVDIRKPSLVQNEIYRQMERFQEGKLQDMGRAVAGNRAPTVMSVPEQIEKLDGLRRQGVITEEEFAAKKRELLDRM